MSRPAAAAKRAKTSVKTQWAEFVVDVWITNFNSIEFGIYKRSRNRAKSRQFSSDMDIFAEVLEKGERTGLLGYREDLWKKSTGMDKRLVFKLFSDSLNWRSTMDLMLGRSLQLTLGAHGLPVTCYSINTGDHDNMVYLERSAHKWPMLPENFSFFLLEDGKPQFFRLRRDFIDVGGDYTLFNQHNQPVGYLDGKVFSIGGKWKGRVKVEHAADRRLLTVLELFCAHADLQPRRAPPHARTVSRRYKKKSGKYTPRLENRKRTSTQPPPRGALALEFASRQTRPATAIRTPPATTAAPQTQRTSHQRSPTRGRMRHTRAPLDSAPQYSRLWRPR